jgi:hypothetical protein
MTKKEKIDALKAEIRTEYEAFEETPALTKEDIEAHQSWVSFRVECENLDDIKQMCHEIPKQIAFRIFEDCNKESGEYEFFFFMKRVGDLDTSDEANERRKKVEDFNKKMHKKIQLGLAKIELEHAED